MTRRKHHQQAYQQRPKRSGSGSPLAMTSLVMLLKSLCATLDRLRQCQIQIKLGGLVVAGAAGQVRPHPLLASEAECRRVLLAHYRALKLKPESY